MDISFLVFFLSLVHVLRLFYFFMGFHFFFTCLTTVARSSAACATTFLVFFGSLMHVLPCFIFIIFSFPHRITVAHNYGCTPAVRAQLRLHGRRPHATTITVARPPPMRNYSCTPVPSHAVARRNNPRATGDSFFSFHRGHDTNAHMQPDFLV